MKEKSIKSGEELFVYSKKSGAHLYVSLKDDKLKLSAHGAEATVLLVPDTTEVTINIPEELSVNKTDDS